MQYASQHRPTLLNLDKAIPDLTPTESYLILNHTSLLTINGVKGNNSGNGKPLPANYLACDLDQPAGEVYVIGAYRSPLTREIYSWHINSNGVHYILRTKEPKCEVVYIDGCLDLSAEPRNSIENWRAFLHIEKICANRDGKYLKWTNGIGNIHMLDVEASIATDSFTTPFFQRCADPCAYIDMCVPEPCGCLNGSWVPFDSADSGLNNFMLDAPFQFIYRHHYYDGRKGEWSIPSTTYYQSTKGCDLISGLSRCIKLRIPIGNPLVEKIEIGFSNGGDVWFSTETVEKYKKYNNSQEKWYNRDLAELTNYSDTDCSFDYIFCNDRQKIQIDPAEISRVFNPIPRDAQGFIQIKEADGVYNYVQGTCPVDKKEIEKFDIDLNCNNPSCTPEFATVTVRAVIQANAQFGNGFVFQLKSEEAENTSPVFFGSRTLDDSNSYKQKFNNKTKNFIAYIEGTDYWVEMKQWEASTGFINRNEVGIIQLDFGDDVDQLQIDKAGIGKYYFQEAKIRVPKGTKGFVRLVSHYQTTGIGEAQNTSTTVAGILDITNFVNGVSNLANTDITIKEVYFDTCNGDTELLNAFLIFDQSEFGDNGAAGTGYVKDENDNPVEGVDVHVINSGSVAGTIGYTDHNGFFHLSTNDNDPVGVALFAEQDCDAFEMVRDEFVTDEVGTTNQVDFLITAGNYDEDWFANVIVPVKDCNGEPVSGVRVAMSGSKYKVSDLNGNANFKLRNYVTRQRQIIAVLMNNNACLTTDCEGGCSPCMPSYSVTLPACFVNTPTVTTPNFVISLDNVINEINGLKAGGRYEFAVQVKGKCGRLSAAYPVKFLNIQKTQEKGFLSFCSYSYNGTGMVLPEWGDCFQILRSVNLNNYELQWQVDKIEKTQEGKIKLTIQSLNDYNKLFGLKTNTTYQWLKGDRVEFIFNGDGSILTTGGNGGILNYLIISPFHDELISGEEDQPADFFNQILIQDDGRLENITEGAIIELQRAVPSQTEQIYYSICASIPIKPDGSLLYPTGTFTTFDTFFVNRIISRDSGSLLATFEHHSPSDFWGDRVSDQGKRYVSNQVENERRFGRNISINSQTNFSRFGDLVKKFEAPGQGDITAMNIVDGKVILAICENDNFLAEVGDDLVRVGSDNIIRALPADAIVSEAQPKLYGAYGCQYDDIGSVYFGDGWATYVDSNKKVHVNHDYSVAKNASLSKAESYFRIRCQDKENHNQSQSDSFNKYRWSTGLNFSTNEVYLTLKTLRLGSIFNELSPYAKKNTTIIFHPELEEYLGFASFTPEFYSQIDLLDAGGCSFVTYSQGKPFVHPIITTEFNRFYDIHVDEMMGVVINKFPEKQKEGQAMEVQSEMMWFAAEITTDKATFISEIPAVRWKGNNGKWNASFLYNKNSRGGLYGNSKTSMADPTVGKYIAVTLVRDNTDELKYGTIDNTKRIKYNETMFVFTKCSLIEQSGFTENL